MMAPILALRFLTLILFFFTNGQGLSVKDLKVKLGGQKQVDSKGVPYITQYRDINNGQGLSVKDLKVKLGDQKQVDSKGVPYITQYRDINNGHGLSVKDLNVKMGDQKQVDSKGVPYITQYGDINNGQGLSVKDLNVKMGDQEQVDSKGVPYITQYGDINNDQGIDVKDLKVKLRDQKQVDSKGIPYITQYGDIKVPYINQYGDINVPYITQYGDINVAYDNQEQPNGISSSDPEDSKGPSSPNSKDSSMLWTSYSKDSNGLQSPKGSVTPTMDRTEAFKTGFFTLDDIYVGNVMTLQFPIQEVSPFLSRKEADSIPLSMSKFPSVLQLLSIPEDSSQAKSMRGTLEECEGEPITGETKMCTNSLESMLEFVDKIIGSDSKHEILTTSYPSPSAPPLQKYTILKVSNDIDAPKWVACHPLSYPYAVHYCHFISTGTKVFKVLLVGEDINGDNIEALGVCHLDTSDWNPNHIIFKQLNIKAGKETPVCHFFPVKHLMWIPQCSKGTM